MPKLTLDQKIAATENELAMLKAKQKAKDDRDRAKLKNAKRKAEVRSAIVVMALLRKMAETDATLAAKIREAVNQITRAGDRAAAVLAGYLVEEPEPEPEKEPVPEPEPEPEQDPRWNAASAGAGEDESRYLRDVYNAMLRLEAEPTAQMLKQLIHEMDLYLQRYPKTERLLRLADDSPHITHIHKALDDLIEQHRL